MPNFASSALRLLRQILASPSRDQGPYAGAATALDGNTAVALVEASISAGAGLGGSPPADSADLVWRAEQQRRADKGSGHPLLSHHSDSPRGALAAAVGLSLSGIRATAFLSAADLASAQDLLVSAAGRQLPLVVHLINRALAGHAASMGSGHEACHISADSGCFMLFAANVQEAVDYTLIARRVAEQTLIPGLVIMDGEQTALAMQDVHLPGVELARRFLGAADDSIAAPTPAHKLLFGDHRRRVPRWHDVDRPVLLGGLQSTTSWGLGKAAAHAFAEHHLQQALKQSFARFAELTGRQHQAFSTHKVADATIVLVVQGAAVETAEAVADHLRSAQRLKVGAVGLRSLRPFPGKQLAELLGQKNRLLVMERMNSPAAEAPPLLRELQGALGQHQTNNRPQTLSVIYGLGGLPLRGADLIELCARADTISRKQVYLGVSFAQTASPYPKRQVLLDRLRREYPDLVDLGLKSAQETPDLRPADALTLAVHRISGQRAEGLAAEIASLLQLACEGPLRSHPALPAESWGACCADRITCAPENLRDPGSQMPVDLSLAMSGALHTGAEPLADLGPNGILLFEDMGPGTELPPELIGKLRQNERRLYRIAAFETLSDAPEGTSHTRTDYLLGAVFGVLLDAGLLELKIRRLLSVHEQRLQPLPAGIRESRLNSFKLGLDRVHQLDRGSLKADQVAAPVDQAPLAVRQLSNIDDAYDSLPRFWDQVAVLYRNRESSQLTPDPYMATGVMPPLSSSFRDLSALRNTFPDLEPTLCNGCGACWSQCPDGAIAAAALTPAALLEDAIGRTGADALRPLASKLAARIISLCSDPETDSTNLGGLLNEASSWLQDKMSLPAERRKSVSSALEALQDAVACLPVVATQPFFVDRPGGTKNDAELLFLAINPDSCKDCGICSAACEPGALSSVSQTRKSLAHARSVWQAWEQLPDTLPTTREKAGQDPRLGPLATALLSRSGIGSLAGGDAAEPGSGERLALRLAMAVTESRQRSRVGAFAAEVLKAKQAISGLIRETLADALPADDLDALARGLETVETRQAELSDFIATAERSIDSGIDAPRLRRLVHLARNLEDLAWRLQKGRQGIGRARLGVVLAAGTVGEWAGVFPNNPFAIPAARDLTGDAVQMAAGMLEGQLQQSTDGFRLLRQARLELEQPADAARGVAELERLSWRNLTAEERKICPPLFVLGGNELLRGGGLSQIDGLLGSDLPIKLLLLNELDLGLATEAVLDTRLSASDDPGIDLGLLTLARRKACIAQTSLGDPAHLMRCLETALDSPGPALLHLHAPRPLHHGFAPDQTLERARLAVESRVLPLFLYDPQGDGVFGSRLSLEGNPQSLSHWATDSAETLPTPASWALGERRFSHCFSELSEDAADPLSIDEYLALDDAVRAVKTPFVLQQREDGTAQRFKVAPELVRVCAERLDAWQVLQEIAGLVTPFTERVEQAAKDRIADEHEAELAALQSDYEARLEALRAERLEQTRNEMRERMMQLAGYTSDGKTGQRGKSH